MGEKRKPAYIILLTKTSKGERRKTNKVEVFPASLWAKDRHYRNLYRLRVNGKWFPEDKRQFFYRTEIMRLLAKSVKFT
jgi:hypothetical protein